ncbi:MAG: hypothetical protein M5R36_26205 [Deltaproteobacteria bacterium]|nr:hypothetical protein [Deltaproteobacteria bacterium]
MAMANSTTTTKEKETAEIDLHRFVLFFGYRFDNTWSFVSEVEFEHAVTGGDEPGEVELEQAFIDGRFHKAFGIQTGVLLIPVGIINLRHEPPTFNGVERPEFHKNVIPTTWWEGGAKIYGDPAPWFSYQILGTSSLDAAGFAADSGVRGGRRKVAEAPAESGAVSGRLDVHPVQGVNLGLSGFHGGTDQIGGLGWPVTIAAADLIVRYWGFELRGEGASVTIGDAEEINAALGLDVSPEDAVAAETPGKDREHSIPERITGALGELSFDVLYPFNTDHSLALFGRFERIDLHAQVVEPFEVNDALNKSIVTFGATYKPIYQIAFKVDGQYARTDEEDAEWTKPSMPASDTCSDASPRPRDRLIPGRGPAAPLFLAPPVSRVTLGHVWNPQLLEVCGMPVFFGILLGFMLGGIFGNTTFGPHGGLVGCVVGALIGLVIALSLRSSWAQKTVTPATPVDDDDPDPEDLEDKA